MRTDEQGEPAVAGALDIGARCWQYRFASLAGAAGRASTFWWLGGFRLQLAEGGRLCSNLAETHLNTVTAVSVLSSRAAGLMMRKVRPLPRDSRCYAAMFHFGIC